MCFCIQAEGKKKALQRRNFHNPEKEWVSKKVFGMGRKGPHPKNEEVSGQNIRGRCLHLRGDWEREDLPFDSLRQKAHKGRKGHLVCECSRVTL